MPRLSCLAILGLLVAIASTSTANAASFEVTCDSELEQSRRGCTIKLSGPIQKGDAARFQQIIRQPLSKHWNYNTLVLDSLGGDVREAMALAEVVRQAMLQTSTNKWTRVRVGDAGPSPRLNWPCVSACFLVWIAGTERFSMSGHSRRDGHIGIGLHRPYFARDAYAESPAKIAEAQQSMTIMVRDYLRREQVPESFIEKMLERSSQEVFWLYESGDPFALNGRASWFEEMMIARCKFDPVYDRETQARGARLIAEGKRPEDDPTYQTYASWRRTYNDCEYSLRTSAQASFRK